MNQPAKFTIAIGITALAMVGIMFGTRATPFKTRKVLSDSEVDDLVKDSTPVKQVTPEETLALKQAEIGKILPLLAQYPIEIINNNTKNSLSKLSISDLQILTGIMQSRSKYPRESSWQNAGPAYNQLVQIISKIKP